MVVSARVTIDRRTQKKVQKVLASLSPAQNRSINKKALRTSALLVQKISTEEMIVRGRGKTAPALPDRLSARTGTLARSIGIDLSPTEATIGTNLVYGAAHEDPKSGQRPRPFLRPALEKASPRFDEIFAAVIERELRIA